MSHSALTVTYWITAELLIYDENHLNGLLCNFFCSYESVHWRSDETNEEKEWHAEVASLNLCSFFLIFVIIGWLKKKLFRLAYKFSYWELLEFFKNLFTKNSYSRVFLQLLFRNLLISWLENILCFKLRGLSLIFTVIGSFLIFVMDVF